MDAGTPQLLVGHNSQLHTEVRAICAKKRTRAQRGRAQLITPSEKVVGTVVECVTLAAAKLACQ